MANNKASKKTETKTKICFAASSGGHYEQIMMLKPLLNKYDGFVVTEKTPYSINNNNISIHYLDQINREERGWRIKFLKITLRSISIYRREKPDVVISMGALMAVPLCIICKLRGKKLIFIESYAKSESPTVTGRFLYRYTDVFYVQWKSMIRFYPKAKCIGSIY